MQEILRGCGDRYGYDDQVAALADLLDMHVYFSPVQEDSSQGEGLPHCQIGNAVFSQYPILEADYEILPWTLNARDPGPCGRTRRARGSHRRPQFRP